MSEKKLANQPTLTDLDFISIEESIKLFGNDPRVLKKLSGKIVVAICSVCGEKRHLKFSSAKINKKCQRCANTIRARQSAQKRSLSMKKFYKNGGRHPLKGIGHSALSKNKMSISKSGKKLNISDATRKKLADHCMKVLNNPETKERTRQLNKLRIGELSPSFGKPPIHTKKVWYTKKSGEQVCFRSTWEASFAKWLDVNNVEWGYEKLSYQVDYLLNGIIKKGTYTPDFFTDKLLYEVKGRWTTEGLAKFNAFLETYPKLLIEVVDRAKMKELGLI